MNFADHALDLNRPLTVSYESAVSIKKEDLERIQSSSCAKVADACLSAINSIFTLYDPSWADSEAFTSYLNFAPKKDAEQETVDTVLGLPLSAQIGYHLFACVRPETPGCVTGHVASTLYVEHCLLNGLEADPILCDWFESSDRMFLDQRSGAAQAVIALLGRPLSAANLKPFIDVIGHSTSPTADNPKNSGRTIVSTLYGKGDQKGDDSLKEESKRRFVDLMGVAVEQNLSPDVVARRYLESMGLPATISLKELRTRTGCNTGNIASMYEFVDRYRYMGAIESVIDFTDNGKYDLKQKYLFLAKKTSKNADTNGVMSGLNGFIPPQDREECKRRLGLSDSKMELLYEGFGTALYMFGNNKYVFANKYSERVRKIRQMQEKQVVYDAMPAEVVRQFEMVRSLYAEAAIASSGDATLTDHLFTRKTVKDYREIYVAARRKGTDLVTLATQRSEKRSLRGDLTFYKRLYLTPTPEQVDVLLDRDWAVSQVRRLHYPHAHLRANPNTSFSFFDMEVMDTFGPSNLPASHLNGIGKKMYKGRVMETGGAGAVLRCGRFFDGRPLEVRLYDKRLYTQVLQPVTDAPVAGRNIGPSLCRPYRGYDSKKKRELPKIVLSLRFDKKRGRYTAKVTHKVHGREVPKLVDLVSRPRLTVLGADLGIRTPVSYSLIETGSGPLLLRNGKKQERIRLLKQWAFSHPEFVQDGGPITPEQVEEARFSLPDDCTPTSVLELHERVLQQTERCLQNLPPQEMVDHCLRVHRVLYGKRGPKGSLNPRRLNTYYNYLRLTQKALRRLKNTGGESPELEQNRLHAQNRFNGLRREYMRLVAADIRDTALRVGADVVVLEKLSIVTSRFHNSSGLNRSIQNWMVGRLIAQVKASLNECGIYVKQVSPANSSRLDVSDLSDDSGYKTNILRRCEPVKLDRLRSDKYAEDIQRCIDADWYRGKMLVAMSGETTAEGVVEWVVRRNHKCSIGGEEFFLVPSAQGTHTDRIGLPSLGMPEVMNADQSAATVLAARGVRSLHGMDTTSEKVVKPITGMRKVRNS